MLLYALSVLFITAQSQVVSSSVAIINFANTSRTYTLADILNPYLITTVNSITTAIPLNF